MIGMDILQPVVALAAWTMVIWLWMYATRIPAMNKAKIDANSLTGGTGKSLDDVLPPQVQWKAHNYNHLHEAPTVFYAVALVLAITGQGDGLNAALGWAYVGLRVFHSLIQATVNRVMVRFLVFALSSLVLIALVVHAAFAVFHG
ncbi:MAG: MAPEG family protein [Novosphingobium sp.]|nr:MAPEG family protein [Novosphingobium sp.]